MTTLQDIIPIHPSPRFDLLDEPWIPVITVAGEQEEVGLATLLREGHRFFDIATDNRLEAFAITRYLLAIGLEMVSRHPDEDWRAVVRKGAPLPETAVGRLLERIRPHTWLFHPETPFMQLPELRTAVVRDVKPAASITNLTDPFASLLPHIPSKNNEAWWYKEVELSPPTEAHLARALLVRHFAATPGNEAHTHAHPKGRAEGGVIVAGPRDSTQVHWLAPTIAGSMVCNLISDDVSACTAESKFFWESPLSAAEHLADPLWRMSSSAAATYAVDVPGFRVLRAGLPVDPDTAKAVAGSSRLHDRLALRVPKKPEDPVHALADTTTIVFDPAATQFENVYQLYRRARDVSSLVTSVLDTKALHAPPAPGTPLRTCTVITAGAATGPRVDSFTTKDVQATPFTLEGERADALRTALGRVAAQKDSLSSTIKYALRTCLGDAGSSSSKVLAARGERELWNNLEHPLAAFLERIASETQPPTYLDNVEQKVWFLATVDAFRTVTAAYEFSPHLRARVARSEQVLRSLVWKTLKS
jgi:hypothetical protein